MKKLMLFLVMILLVGTVSAFEFDNVKNYDKETRTVYIRNSILGIPFLQLDEVASIKLNSELNLKVGWGSVQKVAEFEVSSFKDYTTAFKELELYDKNNGNEKFLRDFQYKYKTTRDVVVNEGHREIVGKNINGTEKWGTVITGSHIEKQEVWLPFDRNNFVKNEVVTIGIFTYVEQYDKVEWIPNLFGVRVEEWAGWEADDNVDLIAYYKMDRAAGVIVDELNNYNATNVGATRDQTGQINKSILNVNNAYVNLTVAVDELAVSNAFTIIAWVNMTSLGDMELVGQGWKSPAERELLLGLGGGGANMEYITVIEDTTERGLTWNPSTGNPAPVGNWTFLGYWYNGTAMKLFVDGEEKNVTITTLSGNLQNSASPFLIGELQQTGTRSFLGNIDEFRIYNRSLSTVEMQHQYDIQKDGFINGSFTDVFTPAITLNSPIEAFNTSNTTIDFNGTITSSVGVVNVSLITDGILNQTNSSGIDTVNYLFTQTFAEGNHNWSYESCNVSECTISTTRTFTIDTSAPTLNVTEPFGVVNFKDNSENQTLKFNVSDLTLDACIFQYEGSNTTLDCAVNISNFTIGTDRTLTVFANDSAGNIASQVVNWSYLVLQTSTAFNSSSFETALERFTLNITTNGSVITAGSLAFDGTENTGATITNPVGDNYSIVQSIDIPASNGTKTHNFNLTISGKIINTTTQNQVINLTNFEFCTGVTLPYMNFSFKNETLAEEFVTSQINADWNFWLGLGTAFKTLTHTNTTENTFYEFCLTDTQNRTLETNVSITYDNSISEQRNFFDTFTLTNTTTNKTLFLLPTTEGLFVTFQTVTVAEQVISGVASNVTKSGDLIETGTTDDAGLVTFFLDPDTTYVFSFFKAGFNLVTTSLKPTQTSFTIIMGSTVIQAENDTTKGINYVIRPFANVLSNNTETNFNLSFSSTFWGLDIFGFALKNSTGNVFNITSSTAGSGGFLSRQLNTGNNTDIIMEIFWTINGNQTNITRSWIVIDTSDEGFSIKTFFDDLSIYLTSGMFGLTPFGLAIIIFGIILLVTGVLAARFANIITNPPAISLIIFSLVLFFDVGLGIMPNPVNAVPNFPTIFMGLIFMGIILKEAIK